MAEITGLNPTMAKAELDEFSAEFMNAHDDLYIELQSFMNELASSWFSPKSVDFGSTYLPRLEDLMNNVALRGREIRYDATLAYNDLARANGLGELPDASSSTERGLYFTTITFKEEGDGGIVGMKTEYVKASVVPNGYSAVKKALAEFDELPMGIAFYDPAGELKAKYKAMINTLKTDVMNVVSEIIRTIITDIETETTIIETAKSDAADTMSTNA